MLEGLMGAGKTALTKPPLRIGTGRSLNIEVDQFFPEETPLKGAYLDVIDRQALQAKLRTALASSAPVVVVEGPLVWPLVEPIAEVARNRIRRVYLKRMMHLNPDFWIDEDRLADPSRLAPDRFPPLNLPVSCRMPAVARRGPCT
ncbi:MAG: hypothetical protein ACXU8R_11000 [Xanthobacteraceae bacterium]